MVTPIIVVAITYILGIICGFYFLFPLKFSFVILIVLFLTALISFRRNSGFSKLFLFSSIFFTGFVLCNIEICPSSPVHVKNFISPWVMELTGTVAEEPQLKGNVLSFPLGCESYTPDFCNDTGSYPVRGLVRVSCSTNEATDSNFTYGDRVSVLGRLQEPSESRNPVLFDYRTYLRNKKILAVFRCAKIGRLGRGRINPFGLLAFRLRYFLRASIEKTLSGDEAGLLKGVMLGDKKDITPGLRDMFVSTGLAHTLAVSGLHVGLVASIFYFFFRFLRLPKKICAALNIPSVITYCLITGANPPAVRATILSVVVLAAVIIEREPDLLNNLALAALIILLINPLSLFDASFQLSFAATAGIVYLVPFFESKLKPVLPGWIVSPLSVSIAAQIAVAPLIAYYFNKVSLVSLIANLFVVPILGIILALGFASAVFSAFYFPAAKLAAAANFACLWYFIQAIRFFSLFPFASLDVATPSPVFICGYYLAMLTSQIKYGKRILFSLLAVSVVFVWSGILVTQNKDRLKIIFFDVGQGESVFIRAPSGEAILIDGGELSGGEYVLSSFFSEQGIRKIDAVISTHPHADHLGGLIPVVDGFKIGRVLANESGDSSPFSNDFRQLVRDKKILYDVLCCGDEIKIGDKLKIKVLNPWISPFPGEDNNSLVLKLIYGNFEMLLPSDVRSPAQEDFVRNFSGLLGADVLQVPHHGSAEALNIDFLKAVKPRVAIMQLGRFNQFGFPGRGVIQAYERIGSWVYRTDIDGAVQIITDGNTYSIKTYIKARK